MQAGLSRRVVSGAGDVGDQGTQGVLKQQPL